MTITDWAVAIRGQRWWRQVGRYTLVVTYSRLPDYNPAELGGAYVANLWLTRAKKDEFGNLHSNAQPIRGPNRRETVGEAKALAESWLPELLQLAVAGKELLP